MAKKRDLLMKGIKMVTDIDKTPVAKNLFTKCAKCKMELEHIVVAHNAEGMVERVRCLTCEGDHKYRPRKKAVKNKAPARRKNQRIIEEDPARDFLKLSEKIEGQKKLPYTMGGSFKADDVIAHPTFGMGIVVGTTSKKMEVIFEDKPRILVCNR